MNLIVRDVPTKEMIEAMPMEQRKELKNQGNAILKYLRASKKDYAQAFDCAKMLMLNWRYIGQELIAMEVSSGRPKDNALKLEHLNLNHNESSYAQRLGKMTDDEFAAHVESYYDADAYKLPTLFAKAGKNHNTDSGGNDEWYTPPAIIELSRKVMGSIDLDPASCKAAQANVRAKKYFTLKDNGLDQEWAGNVFLNPPYARNIINKWCSKLVDELPNIKQAIVVTNSVSDTAWWQQLIENCDAVWLPQSRIRFIPGNGDRAHNPNNPQSVFYFGGREITFKRVFAENGVVVKKY